MYLHIYVKECKNKANGVGGLLPCFASKKFRLDLFQAWLGNIKPFPITDLGVATKHYYHVWPQNIYSRICNSKKNEYEHYAALKRTKSCKFSQHG